jgi:hypothetical protein
VEIPRIASAMPEGALLPDEGPAGGASNIGVHFLKEPPVCADPPT